MHDHGGDVAALQAGLHVRRPARNGLRLYTTDFDDVSLCDFYRGRQAFLLLSGPSLAEMDLAPLAQRGIVTMGVNNSWSVHRPTLWVCVDNPGRFIDTGWKDAGILKFAPMELWNVRLRVRKADGTMRPSAFRVCQMPGVLLYRRSERFDPTTFLDEDVVCWGNHTKVTDALGVKGKRSVMMAALRLLHYLGFHTVYLLGADFRMTEQRGYAFPEVRTPQAVRHNTLLFEALNTRFAAMRDYFKRSRFSVFNCTPDSGLTAFPHLPFEQAVAKASAECGKAVGTRGWYT